MQPRPDSTEDLKAGWQGEADELHSLKALAFESTVTSAQNRRWTVYFDAEKTALGDGTPTLAPTSPDNDALDSLLTSTASQFEPKSHTAPLARGREGKHHHRPAGRCSWPWNASTASLTTVSTHLSGLGSELARVIGWTGDGVLALVAEANIRRWLARHERWAAQVEVRMQMERRMAEDAEETSRDADRDSKPNLELELGMTPREMEDIVERLEDLTRPNNRLFMSRRGYPARIFVRAANLMDKIAGLAERTGSDSSRWTRTRFTWRVRVAIQQYWAHSTHSGSSAALTHALAWAARFLRLTHESEIPVQEFVQDAHALLCTDVVPAVCDALAGVAPADLAGEHLRLSLLWLGEIFKKCAEDVLLLVVEVDAAIPFLAHFVEVSGAYFACIHPFHTEKSTLAYFVDVIIPLAKYSLVVRKACADILPSLAHLPISKLSDVLAALENDSPIRAYSPS